MRFVMETFKSFNDLGIFLFTVTFEIYLVERIARDFARFSVRHETKRKDRKTFFHFVDTSIISILKEKDLVMKGKKVYP